MSFLYDRQQNERPEKIKNSRFRITQIGEEELNNFDGSVRLRVLMALQSSDGSMGFEELRNRSRVSSGQLESILKRLGKDGSVTTANEYISG